RTRKGFRVKTKLRRQLAASQRKIQRRLDKTKFPKKSGPVLAGGNLRYEFAERIHGLGYGGVALFHQLQTYRRYLSHPLGPPAHPQPPPRGRLLPPFQVAHINTLQDVYDEVRL